MKYIPLLFSILLLLATVWMTGCDSTVDEDGTAIAQLMVEPMVGGTPLSLDPNTIYQINGLATTLESARMYVSEITLLKADGSEVKLTADPITVPAKGENDTEVTHTVEDRIVLFKHDAGDTDFALGEVPTGSYTGIRFKLGIDGMNNRVDPSQVPATHPLAKQTDRNNHWSWNAGYIYLRMDGKVDADGDGTPEAQWDVHLGTKNFLRTFTFMQNFELKDGKTSQLNVRVDYAKILKSVDYTNPDEHICHTMDNMPVAQKTFADLADALTFQGVQ